MRVAVTGATGLIGGALVPALRAAGQEIVVVSRRPAEAVRERFRGESGESGTRGRHDGAGAAQTVADRPRASDSADEPGAGRDAAHGTPPVDATSSGSAEPTIAGVARWDPSAGEIDAAALDGVDAAVHLAGESVMGLWTDRKKQRIRRSRIDGTRLFSETVAGLDPPPATLVSASGINVYGDRPFDEPVDERSGPGEGFLAELGREWEAATRPASEAGIRVVNTRIGLVLSPRGGLLRVMLPIFRLGLGGRIGDPERPWSWVAIDDVVGAMMHALGAGTADGPDEGGGRRGSVVRSEPGGRPEFGAADRTSDGESLAGPVNVVSPNPVTHAEFVGTLARVLRRPAIFMVPAFLPRLVLDRDQADETILHGLRALPRRLRESGYRFRFATLEPALRHLLDRE